jgi:nicotinamidase-related amidase
MEKALIVIDVQNYYLNEITRDVPPKIANYIEKSNFDHVLFTKFINHNDSNAARAFGWYGNQNPPETDICIELVKYSNKENTFNKDTYSAFKSEDFRKYLEDNKITNLFICGFDTDACVLATSYEAFDLGYRVEVLEDLTASTKGREYRDSGLLIIKRRIQSRL